MNVKIYTFETCPFCIKAKQVLTKLGLEYTETVVTREEVQELSKTTNMTTVPQILFDDKVIGGSSELIALVQSGEIKQYL